MLSFKSNMVKSDIETPQSFMVEKSKLRINYYAGCVANVYFLELLVILVSSNKLRKIVCCTCDSKDAAMRIC